MIFVSKWNYLHFVCFTWPAPLLIFIYPVDHVFEQILNSSSSELAEARQILHDVTCRRLYKCLGQTQADKPVDVTQVCVFVFVYGSIVMHIHFSQQPCLY